MAKSLVTIEIISEVTDRDILNLKKDIKRQVIHNNERLEKELVQSTERLKSQLMVFVQEPKVTIEQLDKQLADLHDSRRDRQEAFKQEVQIQQSSQDVTKILDNTQTRTIEITSNLSKSSGVDIKRMSATEHERLPPQKIGDALIQAAINKSGILDKDVKSGSIFEDNAVVVMSKGDATGAKRVPPRIQKSITPADTFRTLYDQAIRVFDEAMIAIIDESGKTKYYVNPGGVTLQNYVKIHCSTSTSLEKQSQRFDEISHYEKAEFHLQMKGTGLVQFIESRFIDITDVVDSLKNGDPEKAEEELTKTISIAKNKNPHLDLSTDPVYSDIVEKIRQVEEMREKVPSIEQYFNLIETVKNLQIHKKNKPSGPEYSLGTFSNKGEYVPLDRMITDLQSAYLSWKIRESTSWIKSVQKSIELILDKYGSYKTKKKIV